MLVDDDGWSCTKEISCRVSTDMFPKPEVFGAFNYAINTARAFLYTSVGSIIVAGRTCRVADFTAESRRVCATNGRT